MWTSLLVGCVLTLSLLLARGAGAAVLACGDIPCLRAALATANAAPDPDTILLAAGTYPLTTPLPVVTSAVEVRGAGAATTVLERVAGAPAFSLLVNTGTLTVAGLTLQGGGSDGGGALLNAGGLTVQDCVLTANTVHVFGGGGLLNLGAGHVTIERSRIVGNAAIAGGSGGGIAHVGTGALTIVDSVIAENLAQVFGGGLYSGSDLGTTAGPTTILRSTITANLTQGFGGGIMHQSPALLTLTASSVADNAADLGGGGGIFNLGQLEITTTTVAQNAVFDWRTSGAALLNVGGTVLLVNTTVAANVNDFGTRGFVEALAHEGPPEAFILVNSILANNGLDCRGSFLSWDHNLFGDPWVCVSHLNPNDLVGDPHLGPWVAGTRPGQGHFPLLPTSMARNEGGQWLCPATDQVGQRRVGQCDIGAIEFQPAALVRHRRGQ